LREVEVHIAPSLLLIMHHAEKQGYRLQTAVAAAVAAAVAEYRQSAHGKENWRLPDESTC
jgi:hypothetical protein